MRWIKIGVDTPGKPAIVRLANDCGVSRGDAFLAFFRLYSWLDEQTADGTLYADHAEVDAVARLDGLAASLERSGWLTFYPDGRMTVTNWQEHNGQSAKRRAMNARYQTECRERKRKAGLPVRSMPPIRPKKFLDGDPGVSTEC